MIIRAEGDLLAADVDALVNTVNCVGVLSDTVADAGGASSCEPELVEAGVRLRAGRGRGRPNRLSARQWGRGRFGRR